MPAALPLAQAGGLWRALRVGAAVLLPLLLTALAHSLALRPWASPDPGLMTLGQVLRVDQRALQPPPATADARLLALPLFEPASGATAPRPFWLLARFTLEQPAGSTWTLTFGHRTPVLVYLDGRLLANSVPLAEADLPPRNLQIGDHRLTVSVPADWLGAGAHELALRVGAAGPSGASVSRLLLGPASVVAAADAQRGFWLGLRVLTALSALVIGTLLLFAWLVERSERGYLWSGLHLLMLTVLLLPYVLDDPLLPAPAWRMLLDAADVLAKGLAPVVIAAWLGQRQAWVRQIAFGYIALALPLDVLAAYHQLPWAGFAHAWPWWALGSRLFMLALAAVVALQALAQRPGAQRLGIALLAGLALWIWVDVSLFAIVLPGTVPVVDLNVLVYAGWALAVGMLLHRRLVRYRQREQHLRAELAEQLATRSEELRAQYAALQSSEQARAAATERERLLQEMHDGLGAQLTSAKMLASGGQLTSPEMVDVLDACLREMRLTVDALSVTDGDLGLLLATLRQRLEPALRAGGIVLEWRVEETPLVPALEGTGGRELARIAQEALANIVHHADASRVSIGTRLVAGGTRVQVTIADDGRGMPDQPVPGRGLRNMRQRATRISASIDWRPAPAPSRGTLLTIELPLGRAAAAPGTHS